MAKIKQLESVLECFEWPKEFGGGSTNPSLIIEYDAGDGREQMAVPIALGPILTNIIKNEVKAQIDIADSEFSKL